MSETLTPIHGLHLYADGDNPGADGLNFNPSLIDGKLINGQTANPSTYPIGAYLLREDLNKLFKNTGTLLAPTWTLVLDGSGAGTPTPKAATFVVAESGGDYTTIEAAVAAVPAGGADIYVREGTFAPADTIALPTTKDVRIRGAGAVGITIITVPSGKPIFSVAAGATAEYAFSGFLAQGNSSSGQQLISLGSAIYVTFEDVETSGIKEIVKTTTTPSVTCLRCIFTMPAIADVSFWHGTSIGGTFTWIYVESSIATPSDNGILGSPDWTGFASYVGGGGGPTITTYNCGLVVFGGFKLDTGKLITTVAGSRISGSWFSNSAIQVQSAAFMITGSYFTLSVSAGSFIQFQGAGAAGGVVNYTVCGCDFNGGNLNNYALEVLNVQGVLISGCGFMKNGSGNGADADINVGSTGGTMELAVVGCKFSSGNPNVAVREFNVGGTIRGSYSTNIGFETSIIISSFSTVDGVQIGQAALVAEGIGKCDVNTTAVGNVGTGEDNLITYSLPLKALYKTKSFVRYTAWGTTANNANAKTLKVYFGTQLMATVTLAVSIAGTWRVVCEIFKTGASTQAYVATVIEGAASAAYPTVQQGTASQTDTAAIVLKCTGEATDNNDIIEKGHLVEVGN